MIIVLEEKFCAGQLVITPGALECVPCEDVVKALRRHVSGDWGDVCPEDREENDRSVREGGRLLSAYVTGPGTKFWLITEGDRSVTTVLLPDEY
jgi:hypothetical protein